MVHQSDDDIGTFEEHKPTMFAALARLARQGYVVAPGEALELMHDFYVEAWGDLQQRYDTHKGAFDTYLYSAFLYFARPRIAEDHKWRQYLRPLDDIERAELSRAHLEQEPQTPFHDVSVVRRAFSALSPEDQRVLELRVVDGQSERQAARRLEMSRYKLRQATARALARLSLEVGESGLLDEQQWCFARRLWDEERSLADAADACDMTTHQGRVAQKELLERLASSLVDTRSNTPPQSPNTTSHEQRRTTMSPYKPRQREDKEGRTMLREPEAVDELVVRLAESADDDELRGQVRERWDEVASYLDEHPDVLAEYEDLLPALYEIMGTEVLDVERANELDEFVRRHRREVRRAVRDVLLPQLPRNAQEPSWLREADDIAAIFDVANGFSMMLRRLQQFHPRCASGEFELTPNGELRCRGTVVAMPDALFQDIHLSTGLPREIAPSVVEWLVESARSVPRLVIDAMAEPINGKDTVIALVEPRSPGNLYEWWSPSDSDRHRRREAQGPQRESGRSL